MKLAAALWIVGMIVITTCTVVLAQRVAEPSLFFGEYTEQLIQEAKSDPQTFVLAVGASIAAALPEGEQRDEVRGNLLRLYTDVLNDDDELENLGHDPREQAELVRYFTRLGYSNAGDLADAVQDNGTRGR